MGYKIKEIRERLGVSQDTLVQKSGVTRQTISALENNANYNVTVGTLLKIANALDVTIDDIFFSESVSSISHVKE